MRGSYKSEVDFKVDKTTFSENFHENDEIMKSQVRHKKNGLLRLGVKLSHKKKCHFALAGIKKM